MSNKIRLDKNQQAAVDAVDNNIIVSASAGAGKTSVLIQRIMKRILGDGLSINEICALTFTDAAAQDMKVKLLESFNKVLDSEDYSDLEKDNIRTQISLVETANISTIHSFCLQIIKNYGYILGMDPARAENTIDTAMTDIYKEKAMKITLDTWAQNKQDEMNIILSALILNPTNLNPLKTAITTTAKHFNSQTDIDSAVKEINDLYKVNDFDSLPRYIKEQIFTYYRVQVSLVKDTLSTYLFKARESYLPKKEEDYLVLQTLETNITQTLKYIDENNFEFYEYVFNAIDTPFKSAPKSPHLKDDLANLQKALNNLASTYRPFKKHIELINDQEKVIKILIDMSLAYLDNYETIKLQVNGLDFDDYEKFALKILKHNDYYIASLMKKEFKEIMVDEFQDTNNYQDSIIRLISTGDNIFRVGDVKQSIYKFRGAKPDIMTALLNDDSLTSIPFIKNYRSSENVVLYNNDLYTELMELTEGSRYTSDDAVSAGNFNATTINPKVELNITTYSSEEENIKFNAEQSKLHIAKLMGQKIIDLTQSGEHEYKDITILVRNHDSKIYLKKAFEAANIPHFIDDMSGFFTSNVINQVLSWLHYSVNEDEYYLVSILNSPFIGYSDDQIAALKIHNKSLRIALEELDTNTYEMIHSLTRKWKYKDVISVLLELYNLNDTYHSKLSIQTKTNLDLLLEKATTFQESNNSSILGFTKFVASIDDSKNEEAVPLNEKTNVIRVQTFHQSKGLQYPVTILWPTGSINKRDFSGTILADDIFGITLKDMSGPFDTERKSLYRILAEGKQTREIVEEYLRLLYVATTRAEQKLILMDFVNEVPEKELNKFLLYNFKSSTELLNQVHSKHIEKITQHIDAVNFQTLEKTQETLSQEYFGKRFDEKDSVSTPSISPQEFEFNKDFIHSVDYGTRLHESVEVLPHRLWTKDDLIDTDPRFHKALLQYNTHDFTQTLYTAKEHENEMPVLYYEDKTPVQGIIDMYAIFEDKVIIVDYKTDVADEETLINRYKSQLNSYKKALDIIYPELEVFTYIYSFYNNTYIEIID
ncbi:MAG: UvrD-helicase domain-containing protein [Erysipelothrix sp.]|nr:UvrD-helicase domain-containing protein [Erysipelothrix sp.]